MHFGEFQSMAICWKIVPDLEYDGLTLTFEDELAGVAAVEAVASVDS